MIIKGSSRGQSASDTRALARHLLAKENEAVEVLESSPYMNELLMAALHRDLMAMAGVSVIPFRRVGA